MIFGNSQTPTAQNTIVAGTKRLSRYSLGTTARISKITAYVDGQGSGAGAGPSQVAKAVIYDVDGNLMGTSVEVGIASSQAAGWVDFDFAGEGILLSPGLYDLGLHAGATSQIIHLWKSASTGTGRSGNDTYADGPSNPIGTVATDTVASSLFATAFVGFEAPDGVDDDYLASLGFQEAQEAFGVTSPLAQSDLSVAVGWHGTKVSPLRGSYGVAQKGGVLTDYVGERVRVTYDERSVLVYVTDERDIDQDLSLSRRAFLALAPLSDGELEAVVEIMVDG